jgi:hypothetical protein
MQWWDSSGLHMSNYASLPLLLLLLLLLFSLPPLHR